MTATGEQTTADAQAGYSDASSLRVTSARPLDVPIASLWKRCGSDKPQQSTADMC